MQNLKKKKAYCLECIQLWSWKDHVDHHLLTQAQDAQKSGGIHLMHSLVVFDTRQGTGEHLVDEAIRVKIIWNIMSYHYTIFFAYSQTEKAFISIFFS